MEPVEFAKCMAVLESGVGREMPKEQAKVWFQVLGDLTHEQLKSGVVTALKRHKFAGFPTVAQIREWSGIADGELRIEDRAVLAWDRVLTEIPRVGGYRSIQFDDPAINATIRTLGGWNSLCETPSAELRQFVRPRFIESYRAHCAAGVSADAGGAVHGLLATDASRRSLELPRSVLVESSIPGSIEVHPPRRVTIEFPEEVRRLANNLPEVSDEDVS